MAKSFKTAKTIKLFLDECEEYVDSLNQDLVSMEQGEFSEDLLQRVSRNLHTLKGSSAMLEFMDISEIAHAAEDTLDELKAQLPNPADALIDDIFEKVDKMTAVMAAIKDGSYEEGSVKPSGGAAVTPTKPETPAPRAAQPSKPAPEPVPEPPPAPPAPVVPAPRVEPEPAPAAEPAPPEEPAHKESAVPAAPAHTGRTNMFEIFGPSLRVALDRCFTVFNDFDSKYVLADDNVDNPEFFRRLMEMSTYLYNSLMGMGESRINELLTRILMLLNRVTAGDIPRTEDIFEAVFTGVSAVKAIIENYINEEPSGEVVDIQPIVQKIELKMAVLKDQRDYMTLESARELFDRFDVDTQIGTSLTPFEKFNIAHSMIEGLNIFDFEIKFRDSDKDDMASMGDFLKPLVDTGRFVACMIWQKAQNEQRLECHFHMYYGTEKSAEEVTSTYGHLSRLANLEMSQISISGTTHARPAAVPEPAAVAAPEPPARESAEAIDPDDMHDEPVPAKKPSAKASPAKSKAPAAAKRKTAAMSTVRVDTNKLDVLVNLIAELVINHNKMEGEIKEFKHTMNRVGDILDTLKMVRKSADLSELNITMDDIMEPFRNLNAHQEVPGLNQLQPATLTDFRNMRSLQDQVAQLFDMELEKDQVISSTLEQVTDLKGNLDGLLSEFQNDGLNIGRVIEELQDETMKLRMLPISGVFNKFPRRVRDMAKQLGKRIDFQMEGEDTELDKTLIEEIEEPLLHIIRNAIDHGVERPDVRIQQGKPGTGIIKASAYHEGNSVVVEVEDNGKGIDPEKVKQSALNKRLISIEEAENMDEKDAINLIFHPGFSTTTQVTDLSGRGVGMDVVKNSIAKLKGMVDVQTEVGGGTTFKLKLPLTLAIIQAMIVKSHGQKFVIPMDPIESTEQLTAYDISSVEGKEVFRYQDLVIPLVKLRDVFNLPDDREVQSSYPVVVVGMGEKKVGVIVDEVIEKQQIVIKNLGEFLGDVKHLSGATIFGDGTVALILDVGGILTSISYIARKVDRKDSRLEEAEEKNILLVDDSLSGRIAQREMLERMGFNVHVASSGMQALTMLNERNFDMVVTDINMPRMDGYELTIKIRGMDKTRRMPIIMVTSDVKKADRNKAYECGVNDFLAKPFSEEELRVTIEKHLRAY